MNKKLLAHGMVLVLLVLMLAAFGGSASAESTAAGLSGTITVSTLAGDPFQSSWRAMFDKFQEETGVTVELDAIPWENLREKQVLELASGSGSYDVVYVHPFWFEDLASNGYLVPITEYCNQAELDKYVKNLLELYSYNGQLYGLPDWIATQILAYRKDLFDNAGLPAPKTWADVVNAAKTLADGDNLYGITFPGKNSGALAGIFNTCLLSNSSWLLDDSGKPNIDTTQAAETVEFLKTLSAYAPPGYQNFHWEESSTVAGSGKAAMALLMTTNVNWLEDPTRSETVGLWGYAPIANTEPGGMVDSYCWSVTQSSKNKDAAAALVRFMGDTDVQVYLTEHMGTAGATIGYYKDTTLLERYPILTAMNQAFGHSAPNPAWNTWSAEQDVLETGLQNVFSGKSTAEEVLEAAQAKMMEGANGQ